MNAFQKPLHSQEILITFAFDECVFSFLARIMPTFGQQGGTLRGITSFQQLEPGFFD